MANGRLNRSSLSPIPGGFLGKDAARAWNAMYLHAKRLGVTIGVNGSDSSYRTYIRQVFWRNVWCGRGNCGNAARPGTSNHGLGLAVDVTPPTRKMIDRIGKQYGWSKEWSDAPGEWWHIRYRPGVWNGHSPAPIDVFTSDERRLVDELNKIRRKHGKTWNKEELDRANKIKNWLLNQRVAIRKASKDTGWNKANRKARYALLLKAYKG